MRYILIIFITLLCSCKRQAVHIEERTVYRDTTVYLPGETITDTVDCEELLAAFYANQTHKPKLVKAVTGKRAFQNISTIGSKVIIRSGSAPNAVTVPCKDTFNSRTVSKTEKEPFIPWYIYLIIIALMLSNLLLIFKCIVSR